MDSIAFAFPPQPITDLVDIPQSQQKVSKKSSKKGSENGERIRATKACDQCSLKRSKCSGESEGCGKCSELGLSCSYTRIVKKRGPAKKTAEEKAAARAQKSRDAALMSSPTDSITSLSAVSQDSTVISAHPSLHNHTDSALPSPILSTKASSTTSSSPVFDQTCDVPEINYNLFGGLNDLNNQFTIPPQQIVDPAAGNVFSTTPFDTNFTSTAAAAASMTMPRTMGINWNNNFRLNTYGFMDQVHHHNMPVCDQIFLGTMASSGQSASTPWSIDQTYAYNLNPNDNKSHDQYSDKNANQFWQAM